MFQIKGGGGGARKECFRLVLSAVNEKYFDKGLREHMAKDYVTVGKSMGKFKHCYD